jgi:beta-carotene 15,15'-dioxygenase
MSAIRVQGAVFCGIAGAVTLASLFFAGPYEKMELIVLAVLIIVLGVPHGALDTVFARQLYSIHTLKAWLGFTVLYITLAAAILALWVLVPVLFLVGFILISIIHFSGDPTPGALNISRMLYGGAIIVFPTMLHADETQRLFAFLVDGASAKTVVMLLRVLTWPWLIGLVAMALYEAQRDLLTGVEIAAVGLIAILAPPLVAFTVFFCGMHSARHIVRTAIYAGRSSSIQLLVASAIPMTAVLAFSYSTWVWLGDMPLDTRIVQIVFVGLAALTVPHMFLVEQVRVSGWMKGADHG